MLQKKLALVLTLVMLVTCIPASALAFSEKVNDHADVLVSRMETSLSNEFKDAHAGDYSFWIPLYDMNDVQYAVFVPLYDEQELLMGYSVMSDINNINVVLVSSTGAGAKALAENILLVASEEHAQYLVYEFPEAFFTKRGDQYYQISFVGEPVAVVDSLKFSTGTVDMLLTQYATPARDKTDQTRAVTTVYGSLTNWDYNGFVPVTVSGGVYYGGYQGWLTDEGITQFYADRSCGVTAAANMMHYMAKNVSGKSKLYTKPDTSKANFSKYQKDVFNYLNPAVWGIPTLSVLEWGVLDYAAACGVSLSAYWNNATWNEPAVRNYIAGGLNQNRPVLLLTWNSPIPNLEWHWVTVTRIYLDNTYAPSPDTTKILTSNWGGKTEYDFLTWVNGSSLYKGVLYFN